MATAKGVLQGYTGVAAVDARHQVIVEAQAHGTGSEQELLLGVVEGMKDVLRPASLITADVGYHSEQNLQPLEAQGIDALVADNGMRQRDERFATQDRHQQDPDPLHDKSPTSTKPALFTPANFTFDPERRTCVCPAAKPMQRSGTYRDKRGLVEDRFRAADSPESATAHMRRKIDSPEGRRRYGRRFATVEPEFANMRHNKRLSRFTLRGRRKVDTQWRLYCLVHNIEKLMRYGKIGTTS